MLDNFGFIKQYDQKLYDAIHEAEQEIKRDYVEAGARLRKNVIEYFVRNFIETNNLKTELSQFCASATPKLEPSTLFSQMRFLTNRRAIRELNNPNIRALVCMHKTRNGFIDYKVNAKYTDINGQELYRKIEPDDREIDAFLFLRWVGNACSHSNDNSDNPIIHRTYENIVEAFRIAYHIFACHFGDNAKYGKYREDRIPIGKYNIEKAFVPSDSLRTGCIMEYEAVKEESGRFEWAIIREYQKNTVDKNFFLRGYDTTIFTKYQLIDMPAPMIAVENLTQFDSELSQYYTVAYTFTRKPQKLSDIIKEIDFKNRYDMCLRIAKCFEELHTGDKPLYHRMLNYNCIYTLDCRDVGRGWVASVLKFDFSKIPDKGEENTVFYNAWNAQGKITEESEKKYLAPEWAEDNRNAEWEKVDIYSLGVLFCDILSGGILKNTAALENSFREMLDSGVDREVVETIFNMTAEMVDDRPIIEDVVSVLKKHRN